MVTPTLISIRRQLRNTIADSSKVPSSAAATDRSISRMMPFLTSVAAVSLAAASPLASVARAKVRS